MANLETAILTRTAAATNLLLHAERTIIDGLARPCSNCRSGEQCQWKSSCLVFLERGPERREPRPKEVALGDVLADLAARFPALGEACIEARKLRPSFTANLGGRRFVTEPETPSTKGRGVAAFGRCRRMTR